MERTSVQTDIKGAYLKSELDSEALYLRDSAESRGLLNANPTSAPTVVGVTEPGSDTGTATTEADRVCWSLRLHIILYRLAWHISYYAFPHLMVSPYLNMTCLSIEP